MTRKEILDKLSQIQDDSCVIKGEVLDGTTPRVIEMLFNSLQRSHEKLAHMINIANFYNRINEDYHELIMSVSEKHEGETRHQTALRYINEAEQHRDNTSDDSRTKDSQQ